MKNNHISNLKKTFSVKHFRLVVLLSIIFVILFIFFPEYFSNGASYVKNSQIIDSIKEEKKEAEPSVPKLDKVAYDKKMEELANNPIPPVVPPKFDPTTGEEIVQPVVPPKPTLWPVKTVYPNDGAILPFNRIIAYYGNLYSTKMGVLGEYEEKEMLSRLSVELKKWNEADPNTPAMPALHYIAVVAQASAGKDGKYRARMPDSEIDKVLAIAEKIDAIVFLDIQVGFSTIQEELPRLEKYLKLPNVHLGMDPEFSMKGTIKPGKVVGTYDAVDVNFAAEYLAKIVKDNKLTPKVLVVHRYTQKMLTNYKLIKPLPEVQIVMHMDGWGGSAKKKNTYLQFVHKEPVQFAGFKLFYKNDVFDPGTVMMTPTELLKLSPKPVYIQYQ